MTFPEYDRSLLQAIVEHSVDGLLVVAEDGVIRFANPAACTILGRPAAALVGTLLGHPVTADEPVELTVLRPGGAPRVVELRATSISWEERPASLASLRDITAHRQAADALAQRERLLRDITDNMSDLVSLSDPAGRVTYASPSHASLGYEPAELRGRTALELVHPDDLERVQTRIAESLVPGGAGQAEYRARCADGTYVWLETRGRVLARDDGTITGLIFSSRDVTERHQAGEALATSESRFRRLFEHSLAPIVVADDQGRYLDVNPAACDLFGLSREQLLTKSAADLATPVSDKSAPEQFEAYQEAGGTAQGEFAFVRADGEPRIALWSASQIAPGEFASVLRDVTELHAYQRQLRAEKDRAQKFLDVAQVMLVGLDAEGRITLLNRHGCEVLGLEDRRAVLGQDWFRFIPPADRDRLRELHQANINDQILLHRRVESPVLTVAGERREVIWRNAAVRDADGTIVGTLSSGEDVTERKQLEQQVVGAQRLEAVGRLAGGVAHDFNNLLTVILATVELVLPDVRAEDPLHDDLLQIREAGRRAESLTRQLLAFSRKQVLQPRVLDLNLIVGDLNRMLGRLIGEDILLRTVAAEGLWPVEADPAQVEQIVINLAVNARDAMPDGGHLTIETANVELDEEYTRRHPSASAGPHVLLAVTDTGCGMSAEVCAQVFEPFFTTKSADRGTGLGLSTVYGIVKQHGGAIWVYSEPGEGTTFKVYLPRASRPQQSDPPSGLLPRPPPAVGGQETLLVAEDEESVRKLARRVLERAGYRVLQARDGLEAITVANEHDGPIDLLLTDVVMPNLRGQEAAARIRRDRPELRVIFMSGYTDNAIIHRGMLNEGVEYLQKPFAAEDLLRRIREVLDAGAPAPPVPPGPEPSTPAPGRD